ncbi:MAG TPA: CDP-alcohol phosphatidyltransferase family protein [Thermomicrobiales bacterium]|nr:CDP-alcohol phosphatidyltransferase family protein [Thermomicrobiales bacterium]
MANLITIGRLILLFVAIGMIYWGSAAMIAVAIVVIAIVFAGDGLDGYVARRTKSTSQFGAVFDIAGDRIVENSLWVIFAELQLIPVWIPLVVLTRGFIVDGIRSMSYAEGMTAFGENNMMRSDFTRWLTAGRFMRTLFGWTKAFGFLFLTGLEGYRHRDAPDSLIHQIYSWDLLRWAGWACVVISVTLTVVRGLPVIYDASALWSKPTTQAPEAAHE